MTETEQLLAIEEIKKLKARYFRCMDKKDWAGFLAVFTPDATLDATEVDTPTDHAGAPLDLLGPAPPIDPNGYATDIAAFVEMLSAHLAPVSSVHHGHMPEIEITSPTTATGRWAMEDRLIYPEGSTPRTIHGWGHYDEVYERGPQGWRIKATKLSRLRVDKT